MKTRLSKTKFLHENLPTSLTLSCIITKKPKIVFCGIKVIEGHEKLNAFSVSQDSSNIDYKEDVNTIFDFHQQNLMETAINTTPDICNQM